MSSENGTARMRQPGRDLRSSRDVTNTAQPAKPTILSCRPLWCRSSGWASAMAAESRGVVTLGHRATASSGVRQAVILAFGQRVLIVSAMSSAMRTFETTIRKVLSCANFNHPF